MLTISIFNRIRKLMPKFIEDFRHQCVFKQKIPHTRPACSNDYLFLYKL